MYSIKTTELRVARNTANSSVKCVAAVYALVHTYNTVTSNSSLTKRRSSSMRQLLLMELSDSWIQIQLCFIGVIHWFYAKIWLVLLFLYWLTQVWKATSYKAVKVKKAARINIGHYHYVWKSQKQSPLTFLHISEESFILVIACRLGKHFPLL